MQFLQEELDFCSTSEPPPSVEENLLHQKELLLCPQSINVTTQHAQHILQSSLLGPFSFFFVCVCACMCMYLYKMCSCSVVPELKGQRVV